MMKKKQRGRRKRRKRGIRNIRKRGKKQITRISIGDKYGELTGEMNNYMHFSVFNT